jgi:hypothetical protein
VESARQELTVRWDEMAMYGGSQDPSRASAEGMSVGGGQEAPSSAAESELRPFPLWPEVVDDLGGTPDQQGQTSVPWGTAKIDQFTGAFAAALSTGLVEPAPTSQEVTWPVSPARSTGWNWSSGRPTDAREHAEELVRAAAVPAAALERVRASLDVLFGSVQWTASNLTGVLPALAVVWAMQDTLLAQDRKFTEEQRRARGLGVDDPREVRLTEEDRRALQVAYRREREAVTWYVG